MNVIKSILTKSQYYRSGYGLTLTDKQLEIVESKEKFVKSVFERGEGCSTACVIASMEYALNNPESNVAIFTSAINIGKYNRELAIDFATSRKKIKSKVCQISNNSYRPFIDFKNGSRIEILGKPNENMIRKKISCAIIDGDQDISNNELRFIETMTASSYGQVISITQK